jgi:hypothetical protein
VLVPGTRCFRAGDPRSVRAKYATNGLTLPFCSMSDDGDTLLDK